MGEGEQREVVWVNHPETGKPWKFEETSSQVPDDGLPDFDQDILTGSNDAIDEADPASTDSPDNDDPTTVEDLAGEAVETLEQGTGEGEADEDNSAEAIDHNEVADSTGDGESTIPEEATSGVSDGGSDPAASVPVATLDLDEGSASTDDDENPATVEDPACEVVETPDQGTDDDSASTEPIDGAISNDEPTGSDATSTSDDDATHEGMPDIRRLRAVDAFVKARRDMVVDRLVQVLCTEFPDFLALVTADPDGDDLPSLMEGLGIRLTRKVSDLRKGEGRTSHSK